MEFILAYLLLVNLVSFFLSFYDKRAAVNRKQRIPEKTLFTSALIGGSIGLYLSMLTFRHKTKHASFMIGVPVIIAIQLFCIWYFNII